MAAFHYKNINSLLSFSVIFICLFIIQYAYAVDLIIEGSGSAEVTYDGETNKYPLQIGFDLDTDFSNPKKAIAVFSKIKWEDTINPRRIKIRVDSTKTGIIKADQQNKRFIFIQDGGQLYFPKEPCQIKITKPYTGSENSHLKGRIDSCIVLSAGIEHAISAKFEIIGTPKYKMKSDYDF